MAFIAGPRQVGKTTCARYLAENNNHALYINWDNIEHRKLIMQGLDKIAIYCKLSVAKSDLTWIVFDEVHKYRKWKLFLKGFFDFYEKQTHIMVTGSAKLDLYRKGGDSLMGRYFLYRMHPLSVSELLYSSLRTTEIVAPRQLSPQLFQQLYVYGGFPEPFTKANQAFFNNWQRLRKQQLLKEDIRELSQIQDLAQLEVLVEILTSEASTQLNIASLANQLNVAQTTINRWINILRSFYYCFTVQPWSTNVRRSLRKMPKLYLWDWSLIQDDGRKNENFIASHLLKAVHYWTDMGFGEYDLFYVRDKEKREVDFLITKNKQPWFLVEVKTANASSISKHLFYFQRELNVPHAFQVVIDMAYEDVDCFQYHTPIIVPAKTLLSQLV